MPTKKKPSGRKLTMKQFCLLSCVSYLAIPGRHDNVISIGVIASQPDKPKTICNHQIIHNKSDKGDVHIQRGFKVFSVANCKYENVLCKCENWCHKYNRLFCLSLSKFNFSYKPVCKCEIHFGNVNQSLKTLSISDKHNS